MTGSDDLGLLKTAEWEQLHDLADRLEDTWRASGSADLAALLPPPGSPLRRPFLHELIKTELEIRYRCNRPLTLEDYIKRFPEVGPASALAPALIFEEYRVRHRYGDRPDLDCYRQRFPAQFPVLRELVRGLPEGTLRTMHPVPPAPAEQSAPRPPTLPPILKPVDGTPAAPTVRAGPPPTPSTGRTRGSGQVAPVGEGYTLQQLIGSGQFGEVFRALAPGGIEVAIKRIFRSVDDDSARRERQSLELIKSLRHPFLLQTQAYWALEDRLYIVMELAEDSLADWFKQCRKQGLPGIPAEELLAYFAEAAEALDYLHSQQVVHRDVKPANLLRLRGHAKVADFGLARLQEGRLVTATFCGTPLYMAPEMWQSRLSIHSDQYSLAVAYTEMRLGRRIYSGKDQFEVGRQHLVADPDLSGLQEAEQRVLRRALAKDPERRYPSCRDFIRALAQAQAPPPPVSASRPRLVRWPVLLGVVLLAGLGALMPLAWRLAGSVPSQAPAAPTRPREVWLPEGFVPADDAQILQGHYDRIERRLEGARPIELLLIPRTRPDDPPLFYIMRDKVSNEQFGAALREERMQARLQELAGRQPWAVRRKWEQAVKDPAAGRLPLFEVTAAEAHCFAAWLGGALGKLPSCRQWDKAAGRFDGEEGPFRQGWKKGDLALKLKVPRPVGRSPGDVSRFHCHDMAGNGRELTRDLADPPDATVPYAGARPGQATPVLLRGHSFDDDQPFTFAQVEMGFGGILDYDGARYDIGFRVVIELPVEP